MLARFEWVIVLVLVGAALEAAALLAFLNAFRDTGTRFFAPGEVTLNITKAGDYTLWHEVRTMIDGQFVSFPDDLPSGATVKVLKQPEGTPIALRRKGSSHMEKSGTRRVAVGKLRFSKPGHYQVVITELAEKRSFYLDESKFVKTFVTVAVCGFLGLLSFFSAIGLGVYVFMDARSARQNAIIQVDR